jgi:integrase/recombinase XerC
MLGKGNKRRIVPVGGRNADGVERLAGRTDGWERAGTRWRCLSARVACAHIRLRLKQRSRAAGLATPVHIRTCCA